MPAGKPLRQLPPKKRDEGGQTDDHRPWLPSFQQSKMGNTLFGATKLSSAATRVTVTFGALRFSIPVFGTTKFPADTSRSQPVLLPAQADHSGIQWSGILRDKH